MTPLLPHICDCDDCNPRPYDSRCKHEIEVKRLEQLFHEIMNADEAGCLDRDFALSAAISALYFSPEEAAGE